MPGALKPLGAGFLPLISAIARELGVSLEEHAAGRIGAAGSTLSHRGMPRWISPRPAIRDELVDLMLADAFVLSRYQPPGRHVVDVGSGAGGPGLALSLARATYRHPGRAAPEARGVFTTVLGQPEMAEDASKLRVVSKKGEDAASRGESFDVAISRATLAPPSGSRSERGSLVPRARCGCSWPASPLLRWTAGSHPRRSLSLAPDRRRAARGSLRATAMSMPRLSRIARPCSVGLHDHPGRVFERFGLRAPVGRSGPDRGGPGEWAGYAISTPSDPEQPTSPSLFLGAVERPRSVPPSHRARSISSGGDSSRRDAARGARHFAARASGIPAPASPSALAVADDGTVFVAGEFSLVVARWGWKDGASFRPARSISILSARSGESPPAPRLALHRRRARGPPGWCTGRTRCSAWPRDPAQRDRDRCRSGRHRARRGSAHRQLCARSCSGHPEARPFRRARIGASHSHRARRALVVVCCDAVPGGLHDRGGRRGRSPARSHGGRLRLRRFLPLLVCGRLW